MTSSQKLLAIQQILSQSSIIKRLFSLINQMVSLHTDFDAKLFSTSEQFQRIREELQHIQMPDISEIMSDLRDPNFIIALPIKMQAMYSLFFVLVPIGQKFDWHSHSKMVGVSKCLHGELKISTIDLQSMKSRPHNIHAYPLSKVRYENIKGSDINKVSVIEPDNYNIHRIEAIETSAFFDLLMPDYPDNTCQFYRTVNEEKGQLLIQEITDSEETIKGWDVALQEMKVNEKLERPTYILK